MSETNTKEGEEPPPKKAKAEEEEEATDEWTVLADTYVKVFVPSFAPIYEMVGELLTEDDPKSLMDFGCGPGEPSLTLLEKISGLKQVLGIDSTKSMLDIAKRRAKEEDGRITFHHVRRDVSMADFKAVVVGNSIKLDVVVSTFVVHYLEFPRRVELISTFLDLAPQVLLVTWGQQSKVGFLRAIQTFGTWKSTNSPKKDICDFELPEKDDGNPESPTGSFTMPRKENFQCIVDQMKVQAAHVVSFETRTISIKFPSVKGLLNFLPMKTDNNDCQTMWKLLQSWDKELEVQLGDGPDKELCFPSEVVFCRIARKMT